MMSNSKQFLFTCGAPTGTYEDLQSLLAFDPKIFLGIERFSSYEIDSVTEQMFSKDRFFSFDSDVKDLNKNNSYYEQASSIFENAVYIGDHLPYLFTQFDDYKRNFKKSKLIILLRNISDIYVSYRLSAQGRNKDNELPLERFVRFWNNLLIFIEKSFSDPTCHLVIYENLFSDLEVYKNIYKFLEIELPINFEDHFTNIVQRLMFSQDLNASRESEVREEDKNFIFENANWTLYQSILELSTSDTKKTSQSSVIKETMEALIMDEQDIIAAQHIFFGENSLSQFELESLQGEDSVFVIKYFMNHKKFQDNIYNRNLVIAMANEIAKKIK
jgi:hypothetical protein